MIKKLISTALIVQIFSVSLCYAGEKNLETNFRDFALPSDLEGIEKTTGNVYYSALTKGKVLMPVNVWGEVNKAGVHFIPVDTTLIQGLSLAGGPKSTAVLSNIRLTRAVNGKMEQLTFDLDKGGSAEMNQMKLNSGDTIFVEKEYYYENRAYFVSVLGILATLLSSAFVYTQIKRNR